MKTTVLKKFCLLALALGLTACGSSAGKSTLEPTLEPALPTAIPETATLPPSTPTNPPLPTHTSEPTQPPISFDAATYRDEAAGFEFDYPAGWAFDGGERQSRGYYVQFYSWNWQPGDVVEGIPTGETVLSLIVNLWDPKNDLEAYLDQRKLAWDSSGIEILSEERVNLNGEWPAAQFIVQGADGLQSFSLFTTIGDQYLTLSGSGDLDLLAEIAHTLRLIP